MGMYDTVLVPCPKCGTKYPAQSKSGDCVLGYYELETAPPDVMTDINRHAPFECEKCGTLFAVKVWNHWAVVTVDHEVWGKIRADLEL